MHGPRRLHAFMRDDVAFLGRGAERPGTRAVFAPKAIHLAVVCAKKDEIPVNGRG